MEHPSQKNLSKYSCGLERQTADTTSKNHTGKMIISYKFTCFPIAYL
jgi:hypothetical protein